MYTYYLGQLVLFGFNFPTTGFLPCDGRLLSIANNSALFSLLGTTYGGDGIQTFALPDLRGRTMLFEGQGPGLSNHQIGEASGTETNTLLISNLPAHSHAVVGTTNAGNSESPSGAIPAAFGTSLPPAGPFASGTAANSAMAMNTVGPTGGSQPTNNVGPYLVMNWCIATEGIYPSRS
jgi:microcystin-dependent protein